MSIESLFVLAMLPILSVALFLVILRWPAGRAMPMAYLVSVFLALVVWKVPAANVAAASVKTLARRHSFSFRNTSFARRRFDQLAIHR